LSARLQLLYLRRGKRRLEKILPLLINTEEVGDEVHPLFEVSPILGGGCV
jgi:hypothetical protein